MDSLARGALLRRGRTGPTRPLVARARQGNRCQAGEGPGHSGAARTACCSRSDMSEEKTAGAAGTPPRPSSGTRRAARSPSSFLTSWSPQRSRVRALHPRGGPAPGIGVSATERLKIGRPADRSGPTEALLGTSPRVRQDTSPGDRIARCPGARVSACAGVRVRTILGRSPAHPLIRSSAHPLTRSPAHPLTRVRRHDPSLLQRDPEPAGHLLSASWAHRSPNATPNPDPRNPWTISPAS